jgi:thiol-disulfide isomerase/thioredoxin
MRFLRGMTGILLLALAVATALRVDAAERVPAPNFTCDVWLNSKPLTLPELRGKVVLVDFWEYTCINCIRTFPYLRRWNQLYAPLGLVIIGVHTPEFDFAKSPDLVKSAAGRFGLTFPIAVDSDRRVWAAFNNEAWPADYLIDRNGNVVFAHEGEGDYADMEQRIQALLKEANPKLEFADAKFKIPADEPMFGGACLRPTPELYLGGQRADHLANSGGVRLLAPASYSAPAEIPIDDFALDGKWIAAPEFVQRARGSDGAMPASLALHYRAKSVYLVAGSDAAEGQRLIVTQDNKPLPAAARGVDVKQSADGSTYLESAKKRMYYVVNNPEFGEHTLKLSPSSDAIALYSFTFGNNCENPFDHH